MLPPSVRVYEFVKKNLSTQNRIEPTSNSQCIASFTAARLRSTTLAMHTPASELSDREALQFPSRDLISSEARNRAGLFLILLQRHLHGLLTQWSETRVFPVGHRMCGSRFCWGMLMQNILVWAHYPLIHSVWALQTILWVSVSPPQAKKKR